jgi:hypothetical protein
VAAAPPSRDPLPEAGVQGSAPRSGPVRARGGGGRWARCPCRAGGSLPGVSGRRPAALRSGWERPGGPPDAATMPQQHAGRGCARPGRTVAVRGSGTVRSATGRWRACAERSTPVVRGQRPLEGRRTPAGTAGRGRAPRRRRSGPHGRSAGLGAQRAAPDLHRAAPHALRAVGHPRRRSGPSAGCRATPTAGGRVDGVGVGTGPRCSRAPTEIPSGPCCVAPRRVPPRAREWRGQGPFFSRAAPAAGRRRRGARRR